MIVLFIVLFIFQTSLLFWCIRQWRKAVDSWGQTIEQNLRLLTKLQEREKLNGND